ncbi:MAG TPA: hypothetical protein VGC89_20065 [Pyrinomonadaceae bacterium]|jgi:hypothetical protein
MSSDHEGGATNQSNDADETDARTGQPVEEEEKNLSRHSTKDSSPPVEEQDRTTVGNDEP